MTSKFARLFGLVTLVVLVLVVIGWLIAHPRPTPVKVDFKNRAGGAVVSPLLFGSGGVGTTLSDSNGIGLITSINMLGNRIFVQVNSLYPTSTTTVDYSALDAQLQRATLNGLSPLVVIQGTPSDLGTSSCAMPSDVNEWARRAASVAAHIHSQTGGKEAGFEIWNEPDASNSFCDSDPLNNYLKIYAAAAPALKQAAPVKVGGPTLASPGPHDSTWLPAFLSNSGTAPYVDFVSFHLYISGSPDLPNMTWDQLYSKTQDPTGGLSYYYRDVEKYTRAGSQPNAATTPIYVSEYNANYAFSGNCCQNDNVYGALWNTVAAVDWLNTVNDGAKAVPTRIIYFASTNSANYFCLLGARDDAMDCKAPAAGEPFVPYPQYQAYQLFTSPSFLNLEATGANVVGTPIVPSGLLATAFYTSTADDVVLVNPTNSAYRGVPVNLANLGLYAGVTGQLYVMANGILVRKPMSLDAGSVDSVTAVIDLPPYSTVALALSQ
ncbi:GH39 family glycosyl hydrolase [Alloacidobacterium sp.]|uniref:GH39 family glycosyl hydrolase n=1 Tax=Alloacidobacterium sp. TaxID=2951999 RepID=UPI002D250851|nr:glycosyl hydrolase [Alloacidobacterium sp.]HYK35989.1 glycosyl hydrolase [Alloacidobacterium sp.]